MSVQKNTPKKKALPKKTAVIAGRSVLVTDSSEVKASAARMSEKFKGALENLKNR